MSFKLSKIISAGLLLLAPVVLAITATDSQPPLLITAKQLQCAASAKDAEAALSALGTNRLPDINMPNEWVGTSRKPQLHAATYDIVVNEILSTIDKYPQTTVLAESVLLQWNYCAVHNNGTYYDIEFNNGKPIQHTASTRELPGLSRLGVSAATSNRYIPKAFTDTAASTRHQLVYNWWEIQRKQCLPHPGTGELFYKKTQYGPSRVIAKKSQSRKAYPYAWTNTCAAGEMQNDPHPSNGDSPDLHKAMDNPLPVPQAIEIAADYPAPATIIKRPPKAPVTTAAKPADNRTRPVVYIDSELMLTIDKPHRRSPLQTPLLSTGTTIPGVTVPPFNNPNPDSNDRKYHEITGSFTLSNSALDTNSDSWSLSANFGYKPIKSSYFFSRTGFNLSGDDSAPLTYHWGIGYNDWHANTWAFELNHWGPLKPGDGLELEKAVASLSYKFDSPILSENNMTSSFSLSGGKVTAPALTIAGSWAPSPNWFVRTQITQPVDGEDATWSYGFGFNDWRNETWSLEYNNWGPNKAFDPNFKDNGQLSLGWKWGF